MLDVRVLVVLRAPGAVDDLVQVGVGVEVRVRRVRLGVRVRVRGRGAVDHLPRAVLVGLGRAQDGERGARRAR